MEMINFNVLTLVFFYYNQWIRKNTKNKEES